MPTFTYTARNNQGQQTSGMVHAETNSGAVAQLQEQGLWVTDLKESSAPRMAPRPRTEDSVVQRLIAPVSIKDLSLMYRQLHTMLKAGMPLYQSLEMLTQPNQTPNAALRKVVEEIGRNVLTGGRISDSMERFPRVFDRMQIRMVQAGESGGLLVEIFLRLSDYLEREFQIRSDIKRKTLYPKLVLGLLVLVWPINMPLTAAGYIHDLFWLVVSIVGISVPLWLVWRLFVTSRGGRQTWDQMKLAVPLLGKLLRKMAAARFARTLAALYGAGVPIASALNMSGESCGNYLLEQHTARMVPALERGMLLSQCLQATGFFPPMFLGMVSTGESTGNLDGMLDKAAQFYEEESGHTMQQLVVTMGVLALITVAILVGYKLLTFYTGMFNGYNNAAGGAGGE